MKTSSKVIVTTKYSERPVPSRPLISVVLTTPAAVAAAYAPPPSRRKFSCK